MSSEFKRAAIAAALDRSEKHKEKGRCKHCEDARLSLEALGLIEPGGTEILDPPSWAGFVASAGNADQGQKFGRRGSIKEPEPHRDRFTTPAGLRNSPESEVK